MPFLWSTEQQNAFSEIRNALVSKPILVHFNPSLPIEVRCDACTVGIGAILVQKHDEGFKVVEYASRSLTPNERNYPITEIECLSIVYALDKFRIFLIGRKFKVITDHCALCWLKSKLNLSPRLARWAIVISEYDFEVEYKSGKHNKDSDCLSRNPVDEAKSQKDLNYYYSMSVLSKVNSNYLLAEQKNDKQLSNIINILNTKNENSKLYKKYMKMFTFHNNTLYKKVYLKNDVKIVPVIPKAMRNDIIYTVHDDCIGAHLGLFKTYEKLKSRFYFPKMKKYIQKYIKSCVECQTRKFPIQLPGGLLQPITIGGVCDKFGIDILGPFPKSYRDNKYAIVATEYFTKYAIVRCFPDATAAMTAQFLVENIICTFGAPREVITDRGVQFRSSLMQEVIKLMHTKHKMTTAFHPQTNGLCERFNGTLATMISHYVDSVHKEWDRVIHFLVFAYNSSVQSTTKFSPHFLMFGKEPLTPLEVMLDTPSLSNYNSKTYSYLLLKHLNFIREIALKNIENAAIKNKAKYDLKHRECDFKIGDKVLVFFPLRKIGRSEKLLHKFLGPFKIIKMYSPLVFEVESLFGKPKRDTVHVSRLKHYTDRNEVDFDSDSDTEIYEINNEKAITYTGETEILSSSKFNHLKSISTDKVKSEIKTEIQDVQSESKDSIKVEVNSTNNLSTDSEVKVPLRRVNALQRVNSILWRSSKRAVIAGIREVNILNKYELPCDVFSNEIFNSSQNELLYWCENLVMNNFINPLSKFCVNAEESLSFANETQIITNKPKREIVLGTILLGVIVITSFSTLAISVINIIATVQHKKRLDVIERKQLEKVELIERLRSNDERVKNILESLTNSIEKIDNKVTQLTQRLNKLEASIPQYFKIISNLAARLLIINENLIVAAKQWKQNKIAYNLLKVFNITLPCDDDCPLDYSHPISCSINTDERIVKLKFRIASIKENSVALEADPFVLSRYNKYNELCFYEYSGPHLVLIMNALRIMIHTQKAAIGMNYFVKTKKIFLIQI
ncbi:pol polyprotein-like protein [Leptotrombidium deliense]|uniref:RNA-directed DNA polymerase n=1 Tax=Leptotrombidium deliense TaxID=299467 RepID=A0A443SKN8_9ACAR|nr:pol polyprotein-like protein [Leptotrombidium deliense]